MSRQPIPLIIGRMYERTVTPFRTPIFHRCTIIFEPLAWEKKVCYTLMHCEPNMKESTYEAPSINHLRS